MPKTEKLIASKIDLPKGLEVFGRSAINGPPAQYYRNAPYKDSDISIKVPPYGVKKNVDREKERDWDIRQSNQGTP